MKLILLAIILTSCTKETRFECRVYPFGTTDSSLKANGYHYDSVYRSTDFHPAKDIYDGEGRLKPVVCNSLP